LFGTINLIIDGRDHTLHTYATDILHIRDVLHGNSNTTLVHVLREQNMCAYFMAKEGSHTKYVLSNTTLVHVLREHNMCAYFMAKEGSHASCSARWKCPPPSMESLILRDKLGS
jgi:hypothetical protein